MPKYIYYIRKEKGKYQPYRCSKTKEERILGVYPVLEDAENVLRAYMRQSWQVSDPEKYLAEAIKIY